MDILLQQARAEYKPLLDLSEPIHRSYAERHGLAYMRHDGPFATTWTGHWDAIWLLDKLLACRWTERVIWVDADALIVGDDDPRAMFCETGEIGMCRHPGPPAHWNCGVMTLRNSARVRSWIEEVWAHGPGKYPWYQQDIMNDLLGRHEWAGMAFDLDDRWNSTAVLNGPEACQIRAWHGTPGGPEGKLAAMQRWLSRRQAAC